MERVHLGYQVKAPQNDDKYLIKRKEQAK